MAIEKLAFPRLFRENPETDPHILACRELLRPINEISNRHTLEPYSRAWFEELIIKRYARQGMWLPRLLEFTRHAGDSLLMIRPGLGSDAMQYLRHGVKVSLAVDEYDRADLLMQNFEYHGHTPWLLPRNKDKLPCGNAAFDLVMVNGLWGPAQDYEALSEELFRVLKPGGKVFLLAPALYSVQYWAKRLRPWRLSVFDTLSEGPGTSAKQLRHTFRQFKEFRIHKRHLRRTDLPTAWRLIPPSALERVLGQVLCLKAFKPVRTNSMRAQRVA